MTRTDHAQVAEWDAAYVLGALSPAERREFEDHLEECPRCTSAVAELSALPGLLGRLDDARAFALLDEPAEGPAVPTADLVARIRARDRAERVGRRIRTIAGLAAAAAFAAVLALVLPQVIAPASAPTLAADLVPAADGVPVQAHIELTRVSWGTRIDMECSYHVGVAGADGPYGPVEYAMWVVDRDGAETALSTWNSAPDSSVRVSAGTALSLDDIAEVEVRTAAGDSVLLAAEITG